jgi:hypothetical protein
MLSMILLLVTMACDIGLKCGEGTHEQDGYCVPDGSVDGDSGPAVGDSDPTGGDTDPTGGDTGSSVPPLTVEELRGLTWEVVEGPETGGAVLDVAEGTWRSGFVGVPTVHYDGLLFRMWFVGSTPASGYPYGNLDRIGLATSEDGVTWTLANDDQPVMELGIGGSIDDEGLGHPFVLRIEDTWWMWYAAINGDEINGVRVEQMALATSEDGVTWARRAEPVIAAGQREDGLDHTQVDGAHVLRDDDGGFTMIHQVYGSATHVLVRSTSDDGITWTADEAAWPMTGFSGSQQLGVSVHRDATGNWFTFYQWTPPQQGWTTYAASSVDGIHWAAAYGGQQVLPFWEDGAMGSNQQGQNHSVHPSQLVVLEDRVLFWFMAEEPAGAGSQRIGLAQALR